MSGKSFYNLIEPGMTQILGSHTFNEEEIVEFAGQFDPQPFHLTQEGAQDSHFGRLCASGWHTMAVWMRYNVEHRYKGLREACGYRGDMPQLGASPGIRNLQWLKPVYSGDTITFSSTVTGKRPGRQNGWGLLMVHSEGHNQHGEKVMEMDGAARMPMDA